MSFNFDVEVEDAENGFTVHCTSLRLEWQAIITNDMLQNLHRQLVRDSNLQNVELPDFLPGGNAQQAEEYLCGIVSIPEILRVAELHSILSVPDKLRDSFSYMTTKPDGEEAMRGMLVKNYAIVKRPGRELFFRLFKEPRGATLKMYHGTDGSGQCLGAIRLGKAAAVNSLGQKVPNGFACRTGKRQWVLQGENSAVYQQWMDVLEEAMRSVGSPVKRGGQASVVAMSMSNATAATEEKEVEESDESRLLREENTILAQKSAELESQIRGLEQTLHMLKGNVGDTDHMRNTKITEVEREMAERRDNLRTQFDTDHNELRERIETLYREQRGKPKVDNAADKDKKSKVSLFSDGFEEGDGRDDERHRNRNQAEDAPAGNDRRRTLYRFWHRHNQKHMHLHRHDHVHIEDSAGVVDSYSATKTFTHTICHTTTEMKQKNVGFIG